MRPSTEPSSTQDSASAEQAQRAAKARRAADALLREHPDAMLLAQSADALVVPVPDSLGLAGYPVFATDARTASDLCVAEDRMTMVNAWIRLRQEGVTEVRVRLRSDPKQWWVARMLDLRNTHDVVLTIGWPTEEAAGAGEEPRAAGEPTSTTPRFGTRRQDAEGNVLACDESYLQMFGYTAEEVIGQPSFERVHPEDQARLIESWIAMIATGRVQMSRIRMRRADGSWLWVDTSYHNLLHDPEHGYVLAECIDVSAEMSAQEALQDREELLRRLIEEMPDGLLHLDRERTVAYHNARLLEILCVDATSSRGLAEGAHEAEAPALESLLATVTEEGRQAFDGVLDRSLGQGTSEDVELETQLARGERRQILVKVRPLLRESGAASGVIASVQDVTDSARARRELEKRATFDALTGAHNRSSIIATLAAELEAGSATGVVYVDLDRFKAVNDRFGHALGDELLVCVAERLKAAMRSSDALGRLGGDEFLVVLRGVQGNALALDAAQRISQALRAPCELSCGRVELCASVGVACSSDPAASPDELIRRADAAMYRSKRQRWGTPVLAREEPDDACVEGPLAQAPLNARRSSSPVPRNVASV